FFVVEMLDGSTVESGRTQINAASTAPSTQPSWSTAMTDGAVFSANQVPNAFVNAASDASAAQDVYFSVALDDPQDGVTIQRTGNDENLAVYWQVVEWATTSVGPDDFEGTGALDAQSASVSGTGVVG